MKRNDSEPIVSRKLLKLKVSGCKNGKVCKTVLLSSVQEGATFLSHIFALAMKKEVPMRQCGNGDWLCQAVKIREFFFVRSRRVARKFSPCITISLFYQNFVPSQRMYQKRNHKDKKNQKKTFEWTLFSVCFSPTKGIRTLKTTLRSFRKQILLEF